MAWASVAQKDFKDSVRSRTLWIMAIVLAVITAIPVILIRTTAGAQASATNALQTVSSITQIIVPIMALMASYISISGERESGSIKILLGLPVTRKGAVIGKLIGRSAAVTTAITSVFLLCAAIIVLFYQSNASIQIMGVGGLTVLLGITFTGIGVGLSSFLAAKGKSMASAVALYLILLFWNIVPTVLNMLTESLGIADLSNQQLLFIRQIEPMEAYSQLTQETLGTAPSALLTPDQSIAVLILWMAIPLLLGYRRFNAADLS